MLSIIFLIIGAVADVIFIIYMKKGESEEYMLDSLDGEAFPLKSIYTFGLAFSQNKFAQLGAKSVSKLREEMSIYYSKQYAEYYAKIIWAQTLSFAMFFFCLFMTLAGLTSGTFSTLMALIGVVMAAVSAYYFYTYTKSKIKTRREECELEFPNAITKLALTVNSGVILHEAWAKVSFGKEGTLYDLMRDAYNEMENGKSDIDAIYDFGVMTASEDIKKFASSLIQSIKRGGGELPVFLANQSKELQSHRRQSALQKGEKAAGALLAPIGIMFVGVMLIVLVAAVQSFTF